MEEQSEVERILQLAGIASAPMDPSSLEALRQLTRDRKNPAHAESAAAAAAASAAVNAGGGLATPSFVNTASIPLSSSQQHQQQQHHQQQHEQQQLWEMIQYQTNLLLETQRQLQALNEKVDSLGQDFKTYNKRSDPSFVPQASGATPALSTGATPSEGTANTLPPLQREQLQQQQQLRRGPQNNNDLPLRQRLLQLSIVRIVRLFWIQSKQVVRPIDGALLFKLFFMILILSARMSRSNSNNNPHRRHHQHSSSSSKTSLPLSFLQQYRYALAMMLLLLGFLYHTRYLQFIYQFVWKQNIVMRIAWYGERVEGEESWEEELNVSQQQQQQQQRGLPDDIRQDVPDGNAEPAAEPQPPALPGHARNAPNNAAGENGAVPAQPRHNNNNNHENWWNHYFVGGAIPARNPPPVPNGNENNNNNNNNQNIAPQQGAVGMEIIHIAQDIGYLLGSFVFSIFPMWQPRARPQTEHDMAANDNATTEDDDVVPPIPTVAPPRNAMEPAEEDEEENDGHDNANHNNSGEQRDD